MCPDLLEPVGLGVMGAPDTLGGAHIEAAGQDEVPAAFAVGAASDVCGLRLHSQDIGGSGGDQVCDDEMGHLQ